MASASSQTAAEADRTSSALNDDASSNSSSSSDTNAPLDLTADQEWQDVEPDEEALQFTSFFDDATFGNVKDLLSFTAEKHGLDVVDVARRFGGCVPCTLIHCSNIGGPVANGTLGLQSLTFSAASNW